MMPETRIEIEGDPVDYLMRLGWNPARSNLDGSNNCPFCSHARKAGHRRSICAHVHLGGYFTRVNCHHENISYLVIEKGRQANDQPRSTTAKRQDDDRPRIWRAGIGDNERPRYHREPESWPRRHAPEMANRRPRY
jgi:hypothetical protein